MEKSDRYSVLLIGSSFADEAIKLLKKRASIHRAPRDIESEQLASIAAREAIDGIIIRHGRVTKEVLAASPNLKAVVKHGVGVDNIDIAAATPAP